MNPRGGDHLAEWPAFAQQVRARLDKGRHEYGDRSFDLHPAALIEEVEQELADVCAWSFILWVRLARIGEALEMAERGEPSV